MDTLFLFTGKEEFLKQEAIDKLRSKIFEKDASAGLNFDRFCAGEDPVEKITDCARTTPFMSKNRLIIIERVNKFNIDEKKAMVSFLKDSRPAWCVIVLSAEARLNPGNAFMKAAAKAGRVINFDLPGAAQLIKWTIDRFSGQKKQIGRDAARHLTESAGKDLRQLDSAVELVVTYTGKRRVVKIEDIDAVVGKNVQSGTFDLVDAIGLKDKGRALRILNGLFLDGKRAPEILGLLGWHMRRIWRAKKLMASGRLASSRAAQSVGVPQYLKDKFVRQVNSFKLTEIENGLEILTRTDIAVKSSMLPVTQAIEFLTVQLISGINPAFS